MLSDDELWRVAKDHAPTQYGGGLGSDYQLVKVADVAEPEGVVFSAEFPPGKELTGDAGFFVARHDGQISPMGTGDITRAFMELGFGTPYAELLPVIVRRAQQRLVR